MTNDVVTLEQLRELVAIQADDAGLWDDQTSVHAAYIQQGLRYLTHAIEGDWTFEKAKAAIREMMP